MPRLMYHLVPFFYFILCVITEAFHVFYPDQAELVELNPKEYSTKKITSKYCQLIFCRGMDSESASFCGVTSLIFYIFLS